MTVGVSKADALEGGWQLHVINEMVEGGCSRLTLPIRLN